MPPPPEPEGAPPADQPPDAAAVEAGAQAEVPGTDVTPPATTEAVAVEAKPEDKKDEPKGWRLEKAAGGPKWLKFGLEHRQRFEHLSHDFRGSHGGDVSAQLMRTLVKAVANPGLLQVGIELEDSRIYATDGTPMNTTLSNAFELLEAFVGVGGKGVIKPGDELDVRAGRITIDVGTRRLVARNRYRNTINGFTGLDAQWKHPSEHTARVFLVVPVTRQPTDGTELADNKFDFDEENPDTIFWGATWASAKLTKGTQAEVAVLGFHESDGDDTNTRNRRLFTLQARWFRKPAKGELDFDVELMPQMGKARATTMMADTTDLDHRAISWHAEVGLSPEMPYKPRVALLHDYASGDGDPMDDTLGRFDNLFGARRFDFGPTGTYGIVARQNLQTPGLRLQSQPVKGLKLAATYRLLWIASARDAWTSAGIRDAMGDSGRFIGQHGEIQAQYEIIPKNLALDTGAAYLIRGDFAKTAPNGRIANPAYVYLSLTAKI